MKKMMPSSMCYVSTSKFLKYPFEGDGYNEAWEVNSKKNED
jgi:hypothetical protein